MNDTHNFFSRTDHGGIDENFLKRELQYTNAKHKLLEILLAEVDFLRSLSFNSLELMFESREKIADRVEILKATYAEVRADEIKIENNEIEDFREAVQYFVNRVEEGTIRSKKTYDKYKTLLEKYKIS